MFQVTREIDFCYGHRLLNYNGKCRHLHGHNGRAVITIESAGLDELGMVMDFTEIKRVVSTWIDETMSLSSAGCRSCSASHAHCAAPSMVLAGSSSGF